MLIGSEFFPQTDEGSFAVSIEMPAGATFSQTDEVLKRIEDEVSRIPEIETYYSELGKSESGEFSVNEGVHLGVVVVELQDAPPRKRSTFEIVDELRPRLVDIPAAQIIVRPSSSMGG